MVTLQTAETALKSVYLNVLQNQLNTKINPFFASIKHSTEDVYGKEVVKLVPVGINGGIRAGTEDGTLPTATGNNYVNFKSTLKNIFGHIEISDKAIRASANNQGAFINLLNAEMEGLVEAAKFQFSRMLFGDGSGMTSRASANASGSTIEVRDINGLIEGMCVEFYSSNGTTRRNVGGRIVKIDRQAKKLFFDRAVTGAIVNDQIILQDSKDLELTGLNAIFDTSRPIYGNTRDGASCALSPTTDDTTSAINDAAIQKLIDDVESKSGTRINFMITTPGLRRRYQAYLAAEGRVAPVVELADGSKVISYNGIPIITDHNCPPHNWYLLNTNDFAIHQLADWEWLTGDGERVLNQVAGKAAYSATLVKYAELICNRPSGQARFNALLEA
ncbi:MAG: phage major capsid protein [Firmicutes bacterium]|nr:phage major capsid protein [Bacillota bacterium]